MNLYALDAAVSSAATGDNRNIVLWIILAAVALVLIVLCGAMSAMKKQNDKKNAGKPKDKKDQ
ncbi:MAG: hypothetical protein II916_07340 [Oscillospiraceae bacterium]|nr:hypothetical protein [Oscillospiraceae bacterium]